MLAFRSLQSFIYALTCTAFTFAAVTFATVSFVVLCSGRAIAAEPRPAFAWRFDEASFAGGKFKPLAGGLPATPTTAPKFATEKPTALRLDGKSDRLVVAKNVAQTALPEKAVTVEAWVKIDKPQEWGGIVSALQDNGSYERGFLLGYRGDKFCFSIASTVKKSMTYLSASTSFAPGVWYYVAGVYDGKQMQLFVDGKLAARSTIQSGGILYPPAAPFAIGAYHDDNELYPAAGALSAVAIFAEPLTAAQLEARFRAEKSKYPGIDPQVENVVAWPTYMRDNGRSGLTTAKLQTPLRLRWVHRAALPPSPAWPPPANQDFWHNKTSLKPRVTYDRAMHVVSDGSAVYFGSSSDDKIYSFDLVSGEKRWEFHTGGPVRLAPALYNGRVYTGCDDGYVYCNNARDGSLIWKFNAAPDKRMVPGNGRMISVWPVRTGVMIENGNARFAAGLFPSQGVFQYAVDADTGKRTASGKIGFSPQGYMQRRNGRLMAATGRTADTLLASIQRAGKVVSASLGEMPQRYPFAYIGAGDLRIAGGDGEVAAFDTSAGQQQWTAKVEGRAYSLAVAGGCLLVSTSRGVVYCFESASTAKPAAPPQTTQTPQKTHAPQKTQTPDAEVTATIGRWAPVAARLLKSRNTHAGYCLLAGAGQTPLAAAIARNSGYKTVLLEPDAKKIAAWRKWIDRAQLAGSVSIQQGELNHAPYAPGLFNLIVYKLEDGETTPAAPASAVNRLLQPGGMAVIARFDKNARPVEASTGRLKQWSTSASEGDINVSQADWTTLTRRPLVNAGEWTHMYGDAANTACSGDERIAGNTFKLQWFGRPGPQLMLDRHHRTVPPLYKAGRMFIPGNNRVIAVDAYNGSILWNLETPGSRRVAAMRDAGSMSATADTLYVAAKSHCLAIDTGAGVVRRRMPPVDLHNGQPRDWGYTATSGELLLGSTVKPGASRGEHSKRQINETYWDFVPIVTSDGLFARNRKTGAEVWRFKPAGAIVNPTITIGGGRMYFVEGGDAASLLVKTGRVKLQDRPGKEANLTAIDLQTGKLVYRVPIDLTSIQHHLYLAYSDGMLVTSGTKNKTTAGARRVWYDVHGYEAATGKHVWAASQNQNQGVNGDHGEQDHHPAIVRGMVYQEPYAYNLRTGARRASWKFLRGGHGCGTVSASANAFFFRAGNPVMCDLATGAKTKVTQVSRPGCWINIIPAGGMLLIPEASSGCSCNYSIQSSMAFAPAGLE